MFSTGHFIKRVFFAAAAIATIAATRSTDAASMRGLETHRELSNSSGPMPSLKLQVHIKRSTATIFGVSKFDVVATPVVTTSVDGATSVYYNGMASFDDNGMSYTYKLVDGVAYYISQSSISGYATESVTCLTATSLPPVKEILEAMNAATPIGRVESSETINCPSDKLYKTTLLGETYVLCAAAGASSEALGFALYSSNFDVTVSYLAASVAITKPSISAAQAAACAKTQVAATLTAATASLLTGTTSNTTSTRRLVSEATVTLAASSCSCKGAKRACVFVHGLGQATDQGLVSTFDYFGSDLANHAPCCSSIKYAVLNTVDNAWYSDTLQQRLCDLTFQASTTSSSTTKTIADTIIVTHSMGNLMLGGAIATGKCKLASTSTWVGLSGPMKGSMSSDYLQDSCAGTTSSLSQALANVIGKCPANTATVSMAYQAEDHSSTALDAKYVAAQAAYTDSVSAVMCSNDYSGLLSTDQVALKLAGSTIPHKSTENDGIVEYQSCRAGLATSKFGNSYTNPFYVTKLNHLDTTFRHGDALIQTSQMPVKWFECLL